jgi:Tfp pilus assembly protein PilE
MNSQDRWQSSGEWKGTSKKGLWILLAIAAAAIVVLIYVFAPDFPVSHINSPYSRAHTGMRSIATAMEAYYVDAGAYPAWTTEPSLWIAFNSSARLPSFRRSVDGGPMTLTTPTAFMTSFPSDPFRRDGEPDRTFAYWAPPEGGWILLSAGPDCVFDLDFETLKGVYLPTSYNPTLELIVGYTYNPTNGAVSAGDIWRVKQ